MVPEEETVQNVQLCSGGEECVQACVCLFVRDVADRTTKRLVKISSRNEWKHPHLATESPLEEEGTLGPKSIILGASSPDSTLKLSHWYGEASRKVQHRTASTEGQCLVPES